MSAKSRKDKILEAMEYLEGKEYSIIEALYGFNRKPKRSVRSVKKYFKVSDIYLTVLREKLEELIEEISQKVEYETEDPQEYGFYNVEKIDPEMQKLIDKMSTAFFDMFPETNPLAVEKGLKILPKKTQNIIFLFYGLDGIHCLDYDEIAEQLQISIDEVDEMLEKGINKLKRHFKNGAKEVDVSYTKDSRYGILVASYGKEKIDDAMLLLPELSQKLIEDFVSLKEKKTFREIGEKYGIDASRAHGKIFQGLDRIDQILSTIKNESFLECFYDRFRGYSLENVNSVISKLNYEERKILSDFIGLDTSKLTFKEIIATYNLSEEKAKEILRKSMANVENGLKQFKKKYNKSTNSNTRKNVKQRGKKPEDLTKFYDALN